jgi:hypothetical protein
MSGKFAPETGPSLEMQLLMSAIEGFRVDMSEVKQDVRAVGDKVDALGERVARIEGKIKCPLHDASIAQTREELAEMRGNNAKFLAAATLLLGGLSAVVSYLVGR